MFGRLALGVDLGPLVRSRYPIKLEDLFGKVLAIDAHNALYQFLTVIRGEDGQPLMDRRGRVTSHLSGLFYRTCNFLEKGIKPVYVFDGKPPQLKREEVLRRVAAKEKAERLKELAQEAHDLQAVRKYAAMAVRLTDTMVSEAKLLLDAMGLPYVQAPSEGESQAAHLAATGLAWATVSQDYDSLLFGSPRLVRNLTISGRRKLPGKAVYIEINPELLKLEDVLRDISLTRPQLVDLGILLGTDFNPDGFKGVGQATALKLIHTYGSLDKVGSLREELDRANYQAIREIFLKPDVVEVRNLSWGSIYSERVKSLLCDEHDFSPDRVDAAIARVAQASRGHGESLDRWFG